MKIIKIILWLLIGWFLFPTYNGLVVYILKILFWLLLMYLANIIINEVYTFISKNWEKTYLLYVDEKEQIKWNGMANITRIGFIGGIFRFIFFIRYNKGKMIQQMWYNYLENIAIYITIFIFILIVVAFITFIKFFF